MWLFTKYGFYSIVKKEQDIWQVRARTRKDLENLNDALGWSHQILENVGSDYRWRVLVKKTQITAIFELFAASIGYENFKGMISGNETQADKLDLLHRIWEIMFRYQESAGSS